MLMIGRKLGFVAFIALMALAGMSRASAQWSQCSGEGGTCEMSGPGHHLVRLGAENSYFFLETDGNVTRVPCDTDVFGDPAFKKGKTCDYMTLSPLDPAIQWTLCASEGDTCQFSSTEPRLVKYASPFDLGRAEYRIASTSFPCNNDYFFDVNEGPPKTCWVSNRPYVQIPVKDGAAKPLEFTNCGTEYEPCTLPTHVDAALVRFGKDGKWVYRLASSESPIDCAKGVFAMDPAKGDRKFCSYANVPPRIVGLTGDWQKVGSCANCDNLVQSVTVGVTGSRAKTTSTLWGTEVSFEYERTWGDNKVKIGGKFQYSHTESTEDTTSRSVATTKQATCSAPGKKVTMYQWRMNVTDECYALNGLCQSQIKAFDIMCTAEDIPGESVAACPPGSPPSNTDCAPAPGG
jgi:hypothetical protein